MVGKRDQWRGKRIINISSGLSYNANSDFNWFDQLAVD